MNDERKRQLEMSLRAFGITAKKAGISVRGLGAALRLFPTPAFKYELWADLEHRKKCALIAFAMSQTCSRKKKWILWNLFKNQ
jgi:hypothetical protein